jgi:sugar O-acyltransferase (sialic acid O-acetyltransferase NeuD family)
MIIIGAKGFAKEVLEIVVQLKETKNLVFYDDHNDDIFGELFSAFPILKSLEEAKNYFELVDNRFAIGIGNPYLRYTIKNIFTAIGGELVSTISPRANIGSFSVSIGVGSTIFDGAVFSNNSKIGIGSIVYYNSILTHDSIIGDFVEISPSVTVLGRVKIGSFTQIGANSTILPDITIGENVIIGAGSVVTKDVPDNCMVLGVPARVIKLIDPIVF